jgi:hypothetical protein
MVGRGRFGLFLLSWSALSCVDYEPEGRPHYNDSSNRKSSSVTPRDCSNRRRSAKRFAGHGRAAGRQISGIEWQHCNRLPLIRIYHTNPGNLLGANLDILMEMKQLFVPVILFLCAAYCFKVLVDAAMSYRLVRMGSSVDTVQCVFESLAAQRRSGSLRWGLVLVALGVSLGLIQLLGWRDFSPGTLALLLAGTGLGHLSFFGVTRKIR